MPRPGVVVETGPASREHMTASYRPCPSWPKICVAMVASNATT
jgi:hypothetical protein